MSAIPVEETVPKSNVPPTSSAGMPSISTWFAVEFPPRTNSDVTPPYCPVCTTSAPADWRSASTMPTAVATSLCGISVTAALDCSTGVGRPVAVTVTSSCTEPASSTTFCAISSVAPP